MVGRRGLTLVTAETSRQTWIRLVWSGDIDAYSAPPLGAGLRQAWDLDPLVLEVDLTAVTFMDTAGLRPLVEAHARLLHRLRLFDPPHVVQRVLQLHGLEDMFQVVGPRPVGPVSQPPAPRSSDERVRAGRARGLLLAAHGCDASVGAPTE